MAIIQYTPPPTVKAFIKHYKPHELFFDWIVGPVGSGKTTGIFFKLCYMAGLQAKSPIDGIRRSRCVIVRSTMPQLRDTTIKSFNYWFKDGQAGKWYATDNRFVLRFGDVECEVLFRPLDSPDDVDRVLSLEVTFAIVDEFVQIPQEIIEALSARCGRYPPEIEGGATNWGMWGASNPGQETDWWYAFLEDQDLLEEGQDPSNWEYFKQPSGFADGDTKKYGGKVAENLQNLPGKDQYYTNLIKGKTQHWIKQFVECAWGFSMSGKPVYPQFNSDLHFSTKPLQWNRRRPLLVGYDPGLAGSAFVIGQYDDSVGRVQVLREIVMADYATDRAVSEKLKPMLASQFPDAEVILCPDPSSENRAQGQTGASVMKELKKHFQVECSKDNSIDARVGSAQHYMMRLTGEGPALILDPSCVQLKRALQSGYKYEVSKKGEKSDTPVKNKHSHVADAFSYLTQNAKTAEVKAGEKKAPPPRPIKPSRNRYAMR